MMDFIMSYQSVFLTLVGIVGLIVGSFLNVVIYRLPIMIDYIRRQDCLEFFDSKTEFHDEVKCYNLAYPKSHCIFCDAPIKIWHNIPILSYLILGGKCATCKSRIPLRYLIVEIFTCILSIVVAYEFGFSWECLDVLIFSWFLIAATFIDIDHQILPDILTLSLLWIGLFVNCFDIFANSHDAILGAIIGYSFFWVVNALFRLIRGKEGIGHGDFKLMAAAGAWMGWQLLPFVILCGSVLALLIGGGYLLLKGKSRGVPIPFGPFIAIAMWIGIIWGFDITQTYLHWMGINILIAPGI
ncbi:MAG: A24 family peptidase [Gammaproteobacteria bacterium]|jgi:leader peptidase (prepilin peptidase)/N-methyltransferase